MGSLKFSAMLRIFLIVLLWGAVGIANAATTIMVFGDSLSAGYGLAQDAGWVNLLQKRLDREKYDYKVVNASLSGETTVGGKNRLSAAIAQHRPAIVVVELGINDGMRGADIAAVRANLSMMIADCRVHGARVLLVGMRLPPNYGSGYAGKFQRMYEELAKSQRVPLVPFLFEGFAADASAFQTDNMHPNARAQQQMLGTVWGRLQPMIARDTIR